MLKVNVYFRTDANSSVGMGHLIRCIALAEMIKNDFSINFVFGKTPEAIIQKYMPAYFKVINISDNDLSFLTEKDIIVLDGYKLDSDYQTKVRERNQKIIFIDDLISFNYNVDVIINQAETVKPSDYKTQAKVKFCLGPDYVLLRPPFIKACSEKRDLAKIKSVFVSFGGADLDKVSYKAIKVLSKFGQIENIHVLTSSVNPNVNSLREEFGAKKIKFYSDLSAAEVCLLMQNCELALAPCSNLVLELCAVGIVIIAGTTASNQQNYYNALTNRSAILGIGSWQNFSEEDLYNKLAAVLIYDTKDLQWFIKQQRAFIDGKSGERLLNVFKQLAA